MAIALAALLLCTPAGAQPTCEAPTIVQLTHSSGPFLAANDHPVASQDGRYVAFGDNSFGPSIIYRLDTQTGMQEALSGRGDGSPGISYDGSKVIYAATFGAVGNIDLIATFLYDFTLPPAERARRIAGGEGVALAIEPQMSGDANRLAFFSFFTSAIGGGFGHYIQFFDRTTGLSPFVTEPYEERMAEALNLFSNRHLSFNQDGSRLVFATPADLAGLNADGNYEIFDFRHPANVLSAITHSSGGDIPLAIGGFHPANLDPSVNASGSRTAFLSNRDYANHNADGSFEVFLYDRDIDNFFQLTDTQGGDLILGPATARTTVQPAIMAPAIDGAGNRVVFMSNYDLLGTNPDRNWEIYLWDGTGIPRIIQVTISTDSAAGRIGGPKNSHPALSGDGKQVFFSSSNNHTGQNGFGHDEIFRAQLCARGASVCGNGAVEDGEECDDGDNNSDTEPNACRTDCSAPSCGDNVVDDEPPNLEACDDGNQVDGDDCPASCKFPMLLSPRLILGKGLCGDTPQDLELIDGVTQLDITVDPDITYEWVDNPIATTALNAALKKVTEYLKDKFEIESPELKVAEIEVQDGQVIFKPGEEGVGFNMIRAKRMKNGKEEFSNRAIVIAGLRLITVDSLKIEPSSVANAIANVASDTITAAFGREIPDPPMILFSEGPCDDRLSFIGRTGNAVVKEIKLAFFQGLISDVDLMAGIEQGIGLLPGVHPLAKLAKALGKKALPVIAAQFLDFEVSSEAAMGGEKEDDAPPVTMDAVIEVSDSLSRTAPFFKGFVSARAPGISAVQATLDLGKCLGKATDNMAVFVGPRLEKQEIRNERGRKEDPLALGINQDRTASVVGLINFIREGEEPHEISFDILNILPGKVTELKELIEDFVPGGEKFIEEIGVPVDLTLPYGAMPGDSGLFDDGANYFRFKFTYNPFVPSITLNEVQIQTTLPNLPIVTDWSILAPPNPPPVAQVDQSAGILTGLRRGTGVANVDVCLPFLTNQFSSDINGLRVLGDEMLVTGAVFDDSNGNGGLEPLEPGLSGWKVEVLSGIGNVLATGFSSGDGSYSIEIRSEQLPIGLNTFGIRETPPPGWTPTLPANGLYQGIPIDLGHVILRDFGNFSDVTVRGVKFEDANGNRVQDGNEPGLANWGIELTDARGGIRRAVTAADGGYSFRLSLGAFAGGGVVSVREIQQGGWHQTFPDDASVELSLPAMPSPSGVELVVNFGNQRDEGGEPTVTPTGERNETPTRTGTEEPTPTEEPPTVTPTPTHVGAIGGKKFDDDNGNGVQDPDETGLAGWIIFLDDGDDVLNNPVSGDGVCDVFSSDTCVVTNGNGDYGFRLDGEGENDVREVQRDGWRQTTANPPTLVVDMVGDSFSGINFGNQRLVPAFATGDCDGNGFVSLTELIIGIHIALGDFPLERCEALDRNLDTGVHVGELMRAIDFALNGVPTPRPTSTPTAGPAATATPLPSATTAAEPTATASMVPSATSTAVPTSTPSATPSTTPPAIFTFTPTATRTVASLPTATATGIATATRTRTDVATATRTGTPTSTATAALAATGTPTHTASATATAVVIPTGTPTATSPPTATATATIVPTDTAVPIPTATPSKSPTSVPTSTATRSPTATRTPSVTRTATRTPTATATVTHTRTRSPTRTATMPPERAPEITSVRCNDATGCVVEIGEPFTITFSFIDVNGDATAWDIYAQRDDDVYFDVAFGEFSPLSGGTTIQVFFDPFTCPGGGCRTTDYIYWVEVFDAAGNVSVPQGVLITVNG